MYKAIKWKKASASQLIYLNNNVLLPSIEYRLQTTFLSKVICNNLQRPIWILIKNKLELASSTQEVLGKTTRLRIKEEQLQRKYLSSPISENCKSNKISSKYNLALRVLQEAAKLNIEIKELIEDSNTLNIRGTKITSLLNNKKSHAFHIRGKKRKGHTSSWFIKLEEKTLKRKDTREKEEKLHISKIIRKTKKSVMEASNDNECLISINYKEWHQVTDSLRKEKKDIILGVLITAYTELREIVEDCNFEQDLNVKITANNLESAIIQNLVKDRKLSEDLTSVHEKLRRKEVIEYYTDGALEGNSKNVNAGRMGIGWVVKEEDIINRNISFSSSLENWLSSTRAELGAIWLALLTALCKTTTHILTDSKAAIKLTRLEVLTKLDISLSETPLKEVIYGIEAEEKLHNQKMHLRGLTSIKQLTSLKKEKEKRQQKEKRKQRKYRARGDSKESIKEKKLRLQEETLNRVDRWVKLGKKKE
ncbi:12414_t:CDS:2 [Cetraspora pellucida]|uniref:12414_t:CDS:1 n=1 Tax=Cetraspora pellucida TaxID=1433469 RepID=A0ACA9KKB9_9GLOM|nr:12414_t:CDS:2 [Cetraspora pellucida]